MNNTSMMKKYLSILLAFCVTFVFMYFVVFTASHEFHDCIGEDCKVCHELQLINHIEKQLQAIVATIAFGIVLLIVKRIQIDNSFGFILKRNPIDDKVRMDD